MTATGRDPGRLRRLALAGLVIAVLAPSAGCRAIDHKYWSLPVTTAIQEARWAPRHPGWNAFVRTLACVFCDLPIWPFTFGHDIYAFFALDDEGTLPADTPLPGARPRRDTVPPAPPAVVIIAAEPSATYPSEPADPIEIVGPN